MTLVATRDRATKWPRNLACRVVLTADGVPDIVSRGAILKAHKESYYTQCGMNW